MSLLTPISTKKTNSLVLGIVGALITLAIWWVGAEVFSRQVPIVDIESRLPSSLDNSVNIDSIIALDSIKFANATEFRKVYPILPRPDHVFKSYQSLFGEDQLFANALHSIWLNTQGYFWAILWAIPLGFMLGLIPMIRKMFSGQVNALRFLPLTALAGLFMTWFGIGDIMKIAFLSFGILVYLLPIVIQRINEVDAVYLKTVYTLGASDWQTIKTVFFPAVFTKLIDDIRVLTAISWTYIIIAELLSRQKGIGGVGALIYVKGRFGENHKVFAILLIIVLIGILQDRLFILLDKRLFPYKYGAQNPTGLKESKLGILTILGSIALAILGNLMIPSLTENINQIAWIGALSGFVILLFGEFKTWRSQKTTS